MSQVEDAEEILPEDETYPLENWSEKEKRKLVQYLNVHGHSNLEAIATFIPKSYEDVKKALDYYQLMARKCVMEHNESVEMNGRTVDRTTSQNADQVPLSRWLFALFKCFKENELQNEVQVALKLILDCENMPNPEDLGNVDIKMIYEYIVFAFEGRPLPTLNEETAVALNHCLVSLAKLCKSGDREFYEYLKQLDSISPKIPRGLLERDSSEELLCLRQLTSLRRFNPLAIPEKFLIKGDVRITNIK